MKSPTSAPADHFQPSNTPRNPVAFARTPDNLATPPTDERVDLHAALGDPAAAARIPWEMIPAAWTHVTSVVAALLAGGIPRASAPTTPPETDRLLTLAEAAVIANVNVRWFHRHRHLPIYVRLSRKNLRVSEKRLRRYLERQMGR